MFRRQGGAKGGNRIAKAGAGHRDHIDIAFDRNHGATIMRRFARAVVLIGRDAALVAQALDGTGVPQAMADSMETAVELASASAHTGDAVLMSPACASLDMFRDYAHRAQVFCDAVRARALAHGNELEWVA